MTNYIERARSLARSVAAGGATDLTIAIFSVYIAAAGASVKGAWVYIPGRATPLKGFRAAAEYVAHLADTVAFLRNLANAMDYADREVNGPPSLGQTPMRAADLNPVMPTVDDLTQVAQHISELAAQLATVATPRTPDSTEVTIVAGDEAPVSVLDLAQRDVVERMVRRAQYDALREMLSTLDGWIEGARENHEALGRRDPFDDRFAPDDIRNMVKDAARAIGTREPWRPSS